MRSDSSETKVSHEQGDALAVIALLSAAAGAVHAAVIQEHLREWWLFGAFFAVAAAAQLIWTVFVLRKPSRTILTAGIVGNAALVILWLVTRVTGLPVGPEPWSPESFGLPDVVASVFEVALVLSSVVLLRRSDLPERTNVRLERPQVAVFCGAVIAITYIAIRGGGH
jgi:hypothetical protein